jgi:nucleoside-diphosphate-sugar epimerase
MLGRSVAHLVFSSTAAVYGNPEETPITEIRTEFEFADKNIKIIFIQKPDFPVLMTIF